MAMLLAEQLLSSGAGGFRTAGAHSFMIRVLHSRLSSQAVQMQRAQGRSCKRSAVPWAFELLPGLRGFKNMGASHA